MLFKTAFPQQQPNILWITVEDISPTLSMYGDSTAATPNLNALAKESMIYENAFTTVGVCAPSRSSIVTGMQPISIGTMHMRTGSDVMGWGKRNYNRKGGNKDIEGKDVIQYSAVIPAEVKCFPEFLRAAGYYCTNNRKTDYQFAAPISVWDENGSEAHWRNRPEGKPFFSVFNIHDTHESKLWVYDDKPLTVDPKNVRVPPYFPDTPETRHTIARNYSNIELMDKKVGEILDQLKADGLYDNTIIFFFSDHGGPLPRQKRAIYDSGLRVPFFIKFLNSSKKGKTDRMISFVDLAPSILSLVGIKPPNYMQGKAFLGEFETAPREYILASSDRFDEVTDRIRAVRTKNFLYLHNFYPEKPGYKDISYRKQIPMMKPMLALRDQGKLDSVAMKWFRSKDKEELYEVRKDPDNINNLSADPVYKDTLVKMRELLWDFLSKNPDLGEIPESKLISLMWPANKQPETQKPKIELVDGKCRISCPTDGASVVYMIADSPDIKTGYNAPWKLYSAPVEVEQGDFVLSRAERIGYKTSEVTILKVDKP